MRRIQKEFILFCLQHQVVTFGTFTLKSGRQSPYFFNAGLFNTGQTLAALGEFYAEALQESGIAYDLLFGPAYKGIPLVSSVAIALANRFQCDKPYCFNRKEVKDHGEGGQIVGSPLVGRVLIVDDVMTAGTAIQQSLALISAAGAVPAGVIVSLDRQERGSGDLSAIQEIEQRYGIPVIRLIRLDDLIDYVAHDPGTRPYLEEMQAYRRQYGVSNGLKE